MNIKLADDMEEQTKRRGRGKKKNDVVKNLKEVISQNLKKS